MLNKTILTIVSGKGSNGAGLEQEENRTRQRKKEANFMGKVYAVPDTNYTNQTNYANRLNGC